MDDKCVWEHRKMYLPTTLSKAQKAARQWPWASGTWYKMPGEVQCALSSAGLREGQCSAVGRAGGPLSACRQKCNMRLTSIAFRVIVPSLTQSGWWLSSKSATTWPFIITRAGKAHWELPWYEIGEGSRGEGRERGSWTHWAVTCLTPLCRTKLGSYSRGGSLVHLFFVNTWPSCAFLVEQH